jgi:hypothetical protein
VIDPHKEVSIWSKFAVGMLAVAAIGAVRVLIRRNRPVEIPAAETSRDLRDVEGLYAAGL